MGSTELCADCDDAVRNPSRMPIHLVHPQGGELMLFDIYGNATCPACGVMCRDSRTPGDLPRVAGWFGAGCLVASCPVAPIPGPCWTIAR